YSWRKAWTPSTGSNATYVQPAIARNKRESCNTLWDMENIFHSRQSPLTERGRSTAFASFRSKCCRVGVQRSAHASEHRGRELTPTRLPPTKSGVADLPLSVS